MLAFKKSSGLQISGPKRVHKRDCFSRDFPTGALHHLENTLLLQKPYISPWTFSASQIKYSSGSAKAEELGVVS